MLGCGVTIPFLNESSKINLLIGSVLTTVGGAVFSESLSDSKAKYRKEFVDEITPQIEGAGRHLGSAVQRIEAVVREVQDKAIDPEEAAYRINVIVPDVSSCVTDIMQICGKSLDPTIHNNTVRSINDITVRLEDNLTSNLDDSEETRKLLAQLKAQAEQLRQSSTGQDEQREEIIECPYCSSKQRILLGKSFGASTTPVCTSCNNRFHAHRNSHGIPFAKRWGGSDIYGNNSDEPGLRQEYSLSCPTCANQISFRFQSEDDGPLERYCIGCGELVKVNSKGEIIFSVSRELIKSTPPNGSSSKNRLYCPIHKESNKPFFKSESRAFSVCSSGSHLIFSDLLVEDD